jgi:hypothetical protein
VPILGNTIVGIYDLIQNHRAEVEEREDQDSEARMLGLEVSQLPQSISERRQIIENKRQEKLQEIAQQSIKALDMEIVGMRQSIEQFRKIIDNPDEPLEVTRCFGLLRETYNGTHREKIDYIWLNFKLMYAFQDLGSSFLILGELDQNEIISQKQREVSELKKELSGLRQTSYREYIQSIRTEELLQEAQKYYLKSFPEEEREGLTASVEQMTLETLVPKLEERVLAQAKNDYNIIEMREIISQIECI